MATNNAANIVTGIAGTILQGAGVGTAPAYSTATYPSTAGTSGKVLISDGTNIVSSTPTFPNASATSGKFIRSDGTNWIASTPGLPTSIGGTGTILRSDGTNWASTTATYPATTTANRILYSSSTSVIGEITSANNGVLNTNGSGVPSIATSPSISGSWTTTAGNLALPTTSSTAGNVTINGVRYLHGFGSINTFVGPTSGNYTLSGSENTGVGSTALSALTSGTLNVAIGGRCAAAVTSGNSNTAVGTAAMQSANASNQCAFGQEALKNNTGGSNCAFGYQAMTGSGTGVQNSCFGIATGSKITNGSDNSCFGYNAGLNLLTGNENLLLGKNAGTNYNAAESNNIAIGNPGVNGESFIIRLGTVGSHTACSIAGIHGVTVAASTAVVIDANGVLGTIVSSEKYKEDIKDLEGTILDLRPVSFKYKSTQEHSVGFIAEEVAKDHPELCVFNKDGDPETVKYHEFPALLLKEVQRLSKRVDELERVLCPN